MPPPLPWDETNAQLAYPKPRREQRTPEQVDTTPLKFRKIHPLRDKGYLRSLTFQVCNIEGKTNRRNGVVHVCYHPRGRFGNRWYSDPAHTGKAISGRLKRADSGAFSLCRHAHDEQEGNMQRFDDDYGIDRFAIAEEQYARYEKEIGR